MHRLEPRRWQLKTPAIPQSRVPPTAACRGAPNGPERKAGEAFYTGLSHHINFRSSITTLTARAGTRDHHLVRPQRLTSEVTQHTHTSTGACGSARAASTSKKSRQLADLERPEVAGRDGSRRRLDLDEDGGPKELGDELRDDRSAETAQDGQVQQGAQAHPPSSFFTDSFLSSMVATGSLTSSPAAHRDGRWRVWGRWRDALTPWSQRTGKEAYLGISTTAKKVVLCFRRQTSSLKLQRALKWDQNTGSCSF